LVEVAVLLGVEMMDKMVKEGDVVIPIDVIRASTTIIAALIGGAESVIPVTSIREAKLMKKKDRHILLSGERGGRKITGFDLDNSPLEVKNAEVNGKKLVLTTTHGTRLFVDAMKKTDKVFVGALLNRQACSKLAYTVASESGSNIQIVIPRSVIGICIEDLFAAGLIIQGLSNFSIIATGDLAKIAHITAERDLEKMKRIILQGTSAGIVERLGRIDDVSYCLKLDEVAMVPTSDTFELKATFM
jgi:2-phosphosulfolactate phosphatase